MGPAAGHSSPGGRRAFGVEAAHGGDGTFSLTKGKALVDRFRSANLQPFIADGTIVGHYLIDEPQRPSRWGGQIISPSTLEEMARYSKQIWPDMATFARVAPTWLGRYCWGSRSPAHSSIGCTTGGGTTSLGPPGCDGGSVRESEITPIRLLSTMIAVGVGR